MKKKLKIIHVVYKELCYEVYNNNLSICHLFPLLQVSSSTKYSGSIALQDDCSDLRVVPHQLNPILHLHNVRQRRKLDLSPYMYVPRGLWYERDHHGLFPDIQGYECLQPLVLIYTSK